MERCRQECLRLALAQHGLITFDQAIGLGCTPSAFKRDVASGEFERVMPGVYRLRAAPSTSRQLLKAVCLWGGEGTAASHTSAAALTTLKGFDLSPSHIVTTKNPQRLNSDLQVHVVTRPFPGLWSVDGISLTPPWITLIDLGSVVAPEVVGRSLDEALLRGMVTIPQMRWALDAFGRSCHRGTVVLRGLLAERGPGYEPPQSDLARGVPGRPEAGPGDAIARMAGSALHLGRHRPSSRRGCRRDPQRITSKSSVSGLFDENFRAKPKLRLAAASGDHQEEEASDGRKDTPDRPVHDHTRSYQRGAPPPSRTAFQQGNVHERRKTGQPDSEPSYRLHRLA